jgi:enoyl-CoA hydratase
MTERPRARHERRGHVTVITLDRAEKRNAFDLRMLRELADAFTAFEADAEARCAVLCAEGGHFTAGLDLAEVGPAVAAGAPLFPDGAVDPLSLGAKVRTKPLVMAVQGYCLTIGIELLLAADVRLAADDARFGQIEVNRGIFPFGGATLRFPAQCGWGNAMRWLLSGDLFDAREAHRIGLVQEVAPVDALRARALEIADTIARRAPLGVTATLASSRLAMSEGEEVAKQKLLSEARALMATEDAAEGLRSFVERREARFIGR